MTEWPPKSFTLFEQYNRRTLFSYFIAGDTVNLAIAGMSDGLRSRLRSHRVLPRPDAQRVPARPRASKARLHSREQSQPQLHSAEWSRLRQVINCTRASRELLGLFSPVCGVGNYPDILRPIKGNRNSKGRSRLANTTRALRTYL